ncbi:MAG: L-glutamate gamma-semialdehyde dehydrogenase [Planctomycetota bacterium]|jgi:1-pyrroline-5-carboxylate dehydrogenase
MTHGAFRVPSPSNEPVRDYEPGSPERASLQAELDRQAGEVIEVPCLVGGQEVFTGDTEDVVMPHDHGHVLARVHRAGPKEVAGAMDAAEQAKGAWADTPWEERAALFLRAAELLAGPWRDRINASTMLGQSKTVHQAEIDAACELIDFWRFNAFFAEELYGEQPESAPGCWNRLEHRPLDGMVLAITPFNFTSIAANLPTAPALLGNTAIWKPSTTAALSNWYAMQMIREAGLPDGVVNFLPGDGEPVAGPIIADPRLAGIHFTGSTATFRHLWKSVANNIENYGQYPRMVGETGGKDFVFAHVSADVDALAVALVRGAFEYQGQKCSAASRAYVPRSMWDELCERLVALTSELQMGDPRDFTNFLGAVIDARAFGKHAEALEAAKSAAGVEIVCGGGCDDSRGWFVEPTILRVDDPNYDTMQRELFGPILTIFVYDDAAYDDALAHCANSSVYALTGAIFANDRAVIRQLVHDLRYAAGNFYVNDKPTGAVVGQQPFGGSRASGTNDKAGSILNLLRWTSARTIKETFVPPIDWRYPFLGAD